jgi:hypothetical protein
MRQKKLLLDDRVVEKTLRHTALVQKARIRSRIVTHKDPPAKIKKKRLVLEKSLGKWMRFFFPDIFFCDWSPDHRKVIKKIEYSLKKGGCFAVAMPRGGGKSSIVKGAVMFALLTGLRHYVIPISATEPDAWAVIKFISKQLIDNEKLHQYYPHVTTYARATEGKAIKARFQLRADGKSTDMTWGKNELQFPNVLSARGKSYPSCGAVVEARGITGAIRGKWKDSGTGAIIRPDFVIPDDPQTRESAESDSQCAARERIITGDILGLAGPRKRIAAVMPVTIIQKGDLADRFLDRKLHPEWAGDKFKMVYAWPTTQDTLWAEYAKIYREQISEGKGFSKATAYYKRRQKKMDAGAKLGWAARVRDNEISALQTAENLLLEMHDQFYAEMNNDPVDAVQSIYSINSKIIVEHISPLPRYVVPINARVIVAFTDINRVGLRWVVTAFNQDMTAHVCAYGKYPQSEDVWRENAPELERKKSLYAGLVGLGRQIAGLPLTKGGRRVRISALLVDRGYEPETVYSFYIHAGLPFRVFASRGYAAHKYRVIKATLVGAPYEGCHIVETGRYGQFMAHNACYWREVMQRAWLGDVGCPGGATLFKAPARYHMDFADQLCAERLRQKYQTDSGLRWEWVTRSGSHNDWGDSLVGCYVTAAASGLTTAGTVVKQKKRRETRKSKI